MTAGVDPRGDGAPAAAVSTTAPPSSEGRFGSSAWRPAPTDDLIVEVQHVTLRFGGVTSLSDVSLVQHRGELLAVIGPNGAGKTSLFNCLTGVYVPQQGSIVLHPRGAAAVPLLRSRRLPWQGDSPIPDARRPPRARKPNEINRLGIARTFQASRLFSALTAFENVKIGAESRQRTGPVGAMLHLPRTRREERESDARATELLEFVGLREMANELAASLPYGAQRRLEIARALGTSPELLLLDEPAAGTNPSEKLELAQLIARVNDELGVSVLLIEHDMRLVMSLAERIVVLNFGAVIATGTPAEVQRNPAVIEAYLGTAAEGDEESAAGGATAQGLTPEGLVPEGLTAQGLTTEGTVTSAGDETATPGAEAAPLVTRGDADPEIPDGYVAGETWPRPLTDGDDPEAGPGTPGKV